MMPLYSFTLKMDEEMSSETLIFITSIHSVITYQDHSEDVSNKVLRNVGILPRH